MSLVTFKCFSSNQHLVCNNELAVCKFLLPSTAYRSSGIYWSVDLMFGLYLGEAQGWSGEETGRKAERQLFGMSGEKSRGSWDSLKLKWNLCGR